MATDLRALALEQAELLSTRLKELLSSGQGYIRAQFGVDLGLKPELYPTWVILSTAVLGLLLVLLLSWAALCGGLLAGKKRGAPVIQASSEPLKAPLLLKDAKPEEQKKRNKKKSTEKKAQSNGRPVPVHQEEAKVSEPISELPQETKAEKAPVEQAVPAPVQVKKNKKKAKAEGKPARIVSVTDGKEPDDGAWETMVSHREKKQQRRKDKGPDDSGSPGGVEAPKYHVEAPVVPPAPTNARKNREPLHSRAGGKGDAGSSAPAPSGRREEPSVNGGGWCDVSLKIPGQMAPLEDKWSTVSTAPRHRAQPEPQSWGQETQATWSGMDGRMKTDLNPASFSMLGLKPTGPVSHPIDLQWDSHPAVDDEWSGFNGMAAVDPSSDWNAPAEHWGNYEEPPVFVTPPPKEQPGPHKVSDDEKESEDPAGVGAKSKKKKRKKKKAEEEGTGAAQVESSVTPISAVPKPQELPVVASTTQPPNVPSSQSKKCEQTSEPPKPSQKKKVRRET